MLTSSVGGNFSTMYQRGFPSPESSPTIIYGPTYGFRLSGRIQHSKNICLECDVLGYSPGLCLVVGLCPFRHGTCAWRSLPSMDRYHRRNLGECSWACNVTLLFRDGTTFIDFLGQRSMFSFSWRGQNWTKSSVSWIYSACNWTLSLQLFCIQSFFDPSSAYSTKPNCGVLQAV